MEFRGRQQVLKNYDKIIKRKVTFFLAKFEILYHYQIIFFPQVSHFQEKQVKAYYSFAFEWNLKCRKVNDCLL